MHAGRLLSALSVLLVAGTYTDAAAATACLGLSPSDVAKAVRLACVAHDRAARKGGIPDTSRVQRADVSTDCRSEAIALCGNLAKLCYGDAWDAGSRSFTGAVADRCGRRTGKLCTRALVHEVEAAGSGTDWLDRLERLCPDPVTADLGGTCDGVAGNAAARTCLKPAIASLATSIDPTLPPVSPASCGFPGSGVVKPVVPGREFDPALSPWLQPVTAGPALEPAGNNASMLDYIRPSPAGAIVLSVREWTFPVYNIVSDPVADCDAAFRHRCFSDVTMEDVRLTRPWNPTGPAIRNVPIPTGVDLRPDPMGDSHIAIVDWVHGIEYDFWSCRKDADGTWKKIAWSFAAGGDGELHYACEAGGKVFLKGSGNNVIGPDTAKGSGFALTTGLIRPGEIAGGGPIEHALALSTTLAASGGPVPPALLSDGYGPAYPDAPPEGARLQLRPDVWTDSTIDAQPWTSLDKSMARALRDYGGIVTDQNSADTIDFYAEGTSYDPAMYAGIPAVSATEPYTMVLAPSLFTSANARFLEVPVMLGPDDAGARDSDGDGMFDAFEIAMGWIDGFRAGSIANAHEDPDGDGLTNLDEQRCLHSRWEDHLVSWAGFADNPPGQYPCNPHDADTDHDGYDDAAEIAARTDPTDSCRHP